MFSGVPRRCTVTLAGRRAIWAERQAFFFFRVFTTVSSVRSDDIRYFCSGLLDCGSLSTCVLISLFSGCCAALVAVCSKLTSRHVSPIQTTFCGTLFTRTEHPHATWLAPGLALVVYPSQQHDATISIFSRPCPTPHVHSRIAS